MPRLTALAATLPLCFAGCHGVFLGEDFQAEALPHRQVNAWPLIEIEEDPATGETRTLAAGSFVYYHDEPEADATQAAAFPFFWHARQGEDARTRVPPFYWHDRSKDASSTTLWPLFGSYRNGSAWRVSVLSELVSVGADADEKSVDISAPRGVVEYHSDEDETRWSVLGFDPVALTAYHSDSEGSRGHFFPILWHWSDVAEESSSWLALPLFYASSNPEKTTVFALPGVYHRREGDESHTNVLGLLSDYKTDGEDYSLSFLGFGPASLFHSSRTQDLGWAHIFPLYWHHADPEGRTTTLFPFVWSSENYTNGTGRLDILYPLFHSERDGPDANHWSSLFYLARWDRHDAESYDFRILYKLFRHRRDGTRSETAINPLFTYSVDPAQDYVSFSILAILYRYERKGEDTTHRFLHFIKI